MAANHIHFDDQTQYGRKLRRCLQLMEEADDLLADVRDVMIQMRDGNGSEASHYAEVTSRFGFASDAKAKDAFDEIESAFAKTGGNTLTVPTAEIQDVGGGFSSVPANGRAARDQLFAKLRG